MKSSSGKFLAQGLLVFVLLNLVIGVSEPAPLTLPVPDVKVNSFVRNNVASPFSGNLYSLLNQSLLSSSFYQQPERFVSNIAPSGAVSVNIDYEKGLTPTWFVEQQRYGGDLIMAGVFLDDDSLIRQGWKLIDWALDRQSAIDGGFPNTGDPFHSTSLFLESTARGLLLMKQSGRASYNDYLTTRGPKIEAVARWLMIPAVASRGQANNRPYTHRRWILATALSLTAELRNAPDIAAAAIPYVNEALSLQWQNGVNPEKGGGDINYQAFGILLASEYMTVCTDPTLCNAINDMIQRGLNWELSKIDTQGNVSAVCSTRTRVERGRSGALKTINHREIIQALTTGSIITGDTNFLTNAQNVALNRQWVAPDLTTLSATTVVTTDDTDTGWNWTGWSQISDPNAYQATLRQSNSQGAVGLYSFNTAGIDLYATTGQQGGSIEIFIDDVSQGVFSLFSATTQYQKRIFHFQGLPAGNRTIKVVALDTGQILLDYIELKTPLIRVVDPPEEWFVLDSIVSGWTYTGWTQTEDANANCGAVHGGSLAGAYGQYTFIGTDIEYYATTSPNGGVVELFLDNVSQGTFSLYSPTAQYKQLIFSLSGMLNTTHTFRILATDNNSSGVDYLRYKLPIGVPIVEPPNPPGVRFTAIEDTYGRDGSNANNIFGAEVNVVVKGDVAGNNRDAYLKFDLNGFTGELAAAKVRLYPTSVNTGLNIRHALGVLPASNWSENSLTWNNRPTNSNELATWTPIVNTPVTIDVTNEALFALENDKKLSFRVYPLSSGTDQGANYASKENTNASFRPVLIIELPEGTIEPPPSPTPTPTLAPTIPPTATPTPTQAATNSFTVIADTYGRDGTNANNNFGAETNFIVKSDVTGNNRQSYLRFDFANFNGSIAKAEVKIYPTSVNAGSGIIHAAGVLTDNSWGETTLTWNNRPTISTEIATWTPTAASFVIFDVTGQVQNALTTDKKLSLRLYGKTTGTDQGANYASKENTTVSYRPVLIITLATPTPTATNTPTPTFTPIPTFTPTPTATPSPTATPTATATPTVTPTPVGIRPVLECVVDRGNGTYTAYFGYRNDNSYAVTVPVGASNRFSPEPQGRGQPTTFEVGRMYRVFTVDFNSGNLVWTLQGRTSTASSNSARC
jgi:hypothetical protein